MAERERKRPYVGKRVRPGREGTRSVPAPLAAASAVARGADRVLTAFLALVLAVILLYAGYALWDTWRIYDSASVDPSLLQYKPSLELEDDGAGFAELLALNPDVCAWLTVEGTNIDYPVVQGEDNVKYVNTDVYGKFSLSGSIFLDCRNAGDYTDPYSLLYGHHMEGDVMFGELKHFAESSYFAAHESALLYTPDEIFRVELFACLETDAYDMQVFSPGGVSQADVAALLERLKQEACQYREIDLSQEDRILALSTCSDTSTNARTIVFGRLAEFESAKGGEADK